MRRLIANAAYAAWAYQQASVCAHAASFGLAVGLLTLFFAMLANQLVASWLKGH